MLHLGALQAEVVCLAYRTIAPPVLARCYVSLPCHTAEARGCAVAQLCHAVALRCCSIRPPHSHASSRKYHHICLHRSVTNPLPVCLFPNTGDEAAAASGVGGAA